MNSIRQSQSGDTAQGIPENKSLMKSEGREGMSDQTQLIQRMRQKASVGSTGVK